MEKKYKVVGNVSGHYFKIGEIVTYWGSDDGGNDLYYNSKLIQYLEECEIEVEKGMESDRLMGELTDELYEFYSKLVSVGFTPDQAMEIVIGVVISD